MTNWRGRSISMAAVSEARKDMRIAFHMLTSQSKNVGYSHCFGPDPRGVEALALIPLGNANPAVLSDEIRQCFSVHSILENV
jgi:hypothetical protein